MPQYIGDFIRQSRASSMVEFAIAMPVILLLLVGGLEVTRYILMLQKVDKAAYTIADIITTNNDESFNLNELQRALNTLDDSLAPLPTNGRATVIATSFQQLVPGDAPLIRWQMSQGAGGGEAVSEISSSAAVIGQPVLRNAPASLSPRLQAIINGFGGLQISENIIAAEVFYRHTTLLGGAIFGADLEGMLIQRSAFFNPRVDNLINIPGAPGFE